MPKAGELKSGDVVAINNVPCILEDVKVSTPSARGASSIYQLRFRNLITKAKIDQRVKGEEPFPRIDFEKRNIQYLYHEQGVYTFMDSEDFSQFELLKEDIETHIDFLTEDMDNLFALVSNGKILTIELPPSVALKVASCDPSMRAASVTARTKNAILETGLHVQVPEYIESDEVLRIDTRTGKFMSRA